MEKRAILAAVLMAALLMVYQMYFLPAPPQPPPPEQKPAAQAPPPQAAAPPAASPEPAPPLQAKLPEAPRPPQRVATVDTPLYRAVVSSQGGKLQELTLKYRGEKPMVMVGDLGPAGLLVAPEPATSAEVVPMHLSAETVAVRSGQPPGELRLTGAAAGLRVSETLGFHPDTFAIAVAIRIENPSSTPRAVTVSLPWTTRQGWPGVTEKFAGQFPTEVVWATNGHVDRIEDLQAIGDSARDGAWIALDSVWYIAALVPKTPGFKLVMGSEAKPPAPANGAKETAGRATVALRASPTIAPGGAWEGRVVIYAGPKEYERLKTYGLEETINFGGFPVPRKWGGLPMDWFGVPILLLMKWVYKYVGNYGVAIILLTVLSKVLFYPLTVKSLRSMKAMQALGPHVNALRAKYKNDAQKLQAETMALYRKHKVNPMGGCLPMVAQVPIFYALYLALSVSVELQNAAFLCLGRLFGIDLWICDLASYDPTYVLPILMGISMFVQQKMTPTMGDPRQAKMMLVMPFVFTFMFLNLPSGLVLYWFISNVLQILQQKWMERSRPERAAREAKDAGRA